MACNEKEMASAGGTPPRFHLGQTVMTVGFLALYAGDPETARVVAGALISRHVCGDWGELCAEDAGANEDALVNRGRLLSRYTVRGRPVLVITEPDRSATTVLLVAEA